MKDDKKCPNCSRIYRGEGFQGVCTEYCLFKMNNPKSYANPHKITPSKYVPGRKPITEEIRKKRIEDSNRNWIEREEPLYSKPQRENMEKLARKAAFDPGPGSWIKKFTPIRG